MSICASSVCFAQKVDYSLREIQVQGNLQAYYDEDTRREVLDTVLQDRFAFSNLGEMLQQHGGILVSSYGSRGSLAGIKIRGTGDNHTLFQWNGIPVNSLTTGTLDASLIPAGFMERVAITRGASGVVAGNSSFGGAISLENTADWSNKYGMSMKFEIGSFGYHAWMPSVLVSTNQIQYRASFQQIKSENNFTFTDIYKSGSPKVRQTNDSLAQWGLIQNLYIKLRGNAEIDIGLWLQDKDKDIPSVMGSYQAGTANQTDRSDKGYLKLTKVLGASRVLLQMGYSKDSLNYTKINPDNPGSYLIDSHITTRSIFTRSEWRWFVGKTMTVDLGAHSEHPRAWVDAYGSVRKENRVSLITAAKFRFGSWIGNVGLRKEFNSYNPPKPLMSFGISWKSKDMQSMIRGNISNKFRIPSFNERYWLPGGNPGLLPESGWGGEIGWRWEKRISRNLVNQIEPVLFFQKIRDWIQWVPAEEFWYPQNQELMASRGIEFNGLSQVYLGNWNIKWIYKYSFIDAVQAEYNKPDYSKPVIYVPKHQVLTGLTVGFGNFAAGGNYTFLSKMYTTRDQNPLYALNPIHLVNLHASLKHQLNQFELEYYFQINNLFNYQYQMIRSYATPGFSGVLGLKINFMKPKIIVKNEN